MKLTMVIKLQLLMCNKMPKAQNTIILNVSQIITTLNYFEFFLSKFQFHIRHLNY